MLLESLKPDFLPALCDDVAVALAQVESELAQYDEVLSSEHLDPSQRQMLEQLRAKRGQMALFLQTSLTTLRGARYDDDATIVWSRTLQVA
ncbi:MAG: hypothetical protein H0T73_09700 [Ardenticatenales bacterium]|nr:hypothetical protein [Ardenticatenales bacterium]